MRVLMLGNSFTYYNQMPETLAALSGWEVTAHVHGGAFLREHLDSTTELGQLTEKALSEQKWDYVILQEQSTAPLKDAEGFYSVVKRLCEKVRANGAKPVLYATWAYRKGSEKLQKTGFTYEELRDGIHAAYCRAAEENHTLLADVGSAFDRLCETPGLYHSDEKHPGPAGSMLAAMILMETIRRQ